MTVQPRDAPVPGPLRAAKCPVRLLGAALLPLGPPILSGLALILLQARTAAATEPHFLHEVTVPSPFSRALILAAVIGAWVGVPIWSYRITRRVAAFLPSTAAALVLTCAGGSFALFLLPPPRIVDTLRTGDDRLHVALWTPDFVDVRVTYGTVAREGTWSWRVLVLFDDEPGSGESGFAFRPAGAEPERVVLARLPGDGVAVVYTAEPEYGLASIEAAFDAAHRPLRPSPFVLFGPTDVGRERELRWAVDSLPTSPPLARALDGHLAQGLRHESAWVRSAAVRIARAGGADAFPRTLAGIVSGGR